MAQIIFLLLLLLIGWFLGVSTSCVHGIWWTGVWVRMYTIYYKVVIYIYMTVLATMAAAGTMWSFHIIMVWLFFTFSFHQICSCIHDLALVGSQILVFNLITSWKSVLIVFYATLQLLHGQRCLCIGDWSRADQTDHSQRIQLFHGPRCKYSRVHVIHVLLAS